MTRLTWIDALPQGWIAKPLRAIADYVVSNVDKVPSDGEVSVRLCNYSDVYNNEFIDLSLDFMRTTASSEEVHKFGLRVGDVIITKDSESWNDIGVPSYVRETADDLVCGYHLALLRPHPDHLIGRFLLRCLQTRGIRLQLELAANGVTRFGIPKSDIGAMRIPVPPMNTQLAIIEYLDRETAKIDGLIAAKQRLIGLLVEKRKAIIASAVTGGLDAAARMRDSGVPWLGEIPAHWEVERARWLFRERNFRSQTGEEELLTVSHITGVTPRSEKDVNMFKAETTEGYKRCHPGDLVINTLWAWMGAMGVARVDGIVSPAYNVYAPGVRLVPSYIDALVRLPVFAQEVTRHSKGVWSSRLRLYPEGFFQVYFPVPPVEEQQQIVTHIVHETAKLDSVAVATERTIALLQERRAAIIDAAVTGQIELRATA
jgi:type I restriction enzyme S subunit